MNEDSALLDRYVREGSQPAFAELVRRHLPLVYSVACRQVGDTQLAEDVTQQVFRDLARKAGTLSRHPALGAWLYRSTQFAAIDTLRAERRRRAREETAAAMDMLTSTTDNHRELRVELDRAMADLPGRDRVALVLRFFENCAFAELGQRLRVSEDAARMRVERALERLRTLLVRRGVTSTAVALGTALTGQAAMVPPPALAAASAASAGAGSVAGVGILGFMSLQKIVLGGVALAVLLGSGLVWRNSNPPVSPPRPAPLAAAKAAPAVPPAAAASRESPMSVSQAPLAPDERAPRDFASEFSRLMAEPDTLERKERARELLTAWGRTAPREALQAIAGLGLRAEGQELYAIDVFAGWASVDPEAAWAAAPQQSALAAVGLATRATNPYYQKIAGALLEQGKAKRAQQLIAEIADERTREGTFVFMIPYLVKHDFPAATAGITAMRPDGAGRMNALAATGRALAQEFPDMAADQALNLTPPEPAHLRAVVVDAVFQELGRSNQARVASDWIARAPEEFRDVALRSYFGVRGSLTPEAREQHWQKLRAAAVTP